MIQQNHNMTQSCVLAVGSTMAKRQMTISMVPARGTHEAYITNHAPLRNVGRRTAPTYLDETIT